jgi:hypothetical protein
MAKQTIGIGVTANDGTGDTIRDAFDKCNDNFSDVYGVTEYAASRSSQLFDIIAHSPGYVLNATTGASSVSANYWTSDFIPVVAGQQYSMTYVSHIAWYNASRVFISGAAWPSGRTFTAPASAAFMRQSGNTPSSHYAASQMITNSANVTAFETYGGLLAGSRVRAIPTSAISDGAVTVPKTGWLTRGKNLFNPDDSEFLVGSYISSDSGVHANAAYCASGKIYVTPGQQYVATGTNMLRFITAYDANGNAVPAYAGTNVDGFTAPASGVSYYRITTYTYFVGALQIEAGAISTEYEPFRYAMDPLVYVGPPASSYTDLLNLSAMRHVALFRSRRDAGIGTTDRLNIIAIGDSYTQSYDRWTGKAVAKLVADYGDGGGGWTGYGFFAAETPPYVLGASQPSGINGNVRPASYTLRYAGSWVCSYATGVGPDLAYVSSATAGNQIERTVPASPEHTALRVLYVATVDGVVRYQVDGGGWSNENVQGTVGNIGHFDVALTAGAHTIVVEVVSGTVRLCGDVALSAAPGVTLSGCGCSGSRVGQWIVPAAAQQEAAFALLSPDVFVIMDGTNSQGADIAYDVWRTDMATMIDRFRVSGSWPDVLVVMPPENERGLYNAMHLYSEQGASLAIERGITYLNLQAAFGAAPADYASTSSFPLFAADGIHPDTTNGGRVMELAIRRALGLS